MDDITRARRRRNDPEAAKVAEAVEAILDYVSTNAFASKVVLARHNPLCGRPASAWRRAGHLIPYAPIGHEKQDDPIGWCCQERWRGGAGPGRGFLG